MITKLEALQKLMDEYHLGKGFKVVGNIETSTNLDSIMVDDEISLKFTYNDLISTQSSLQAEYDAQEYARNRQAEYPSIEELVVALYDTDDKADIEAKRAEVKKKYPKP